MLTGLWGYLIAGLIALGGVGAAALRFRKGVLDAERGKQAQATVQTQQRMQRAEEAGPRTKSEAVDVLRRGGL